MDDLPDDTPTRASCLSTDQHDDNVTDLVSHYFGCIEIRQRKDFFNPNNAIWKSQMEIVKKKLQDEVFQGDHSVEVEAKKRVDEEMGKTAVEIEARYVRTEIIVNAISKEWKDATEATRNKKPNLVTTVQESHDAWHASKDYRTGIIKVKEWRQGKLMDVETDEEESISEVPLSYPPERLRVRLKKKEYTNKPPRSDSTSRAGISSADGIPSVTQEYCVDRDVNAHIIQYEKLPPPSAESRRPSGTDEPNCPNTDREFSSLAVPSLKPVPFEKDIRLKGEKFPDHRIAISSLFQSQVQNPGSGILQAFRLPLEGQKSDRVRYIHIPSNNMQVSLRCNFLYLYVKLRRDTSAWKANKSTLVK